MLPSKFVEIIAGCLLFGFIAVPTVILISADQSPQAIALPKYDPYPQLNQYSVLTALVPHEDTVFIELPQGLERKRESDMISLTLKSNDLVYQIKIFKKLLNFITLSPDVKYQITWNNYLYQRKVISEGEYKTKGTTHYCWNELKSMDGKVLIYAGDEAPIFGTRDHDERCLVPMIIKAKE